MKQKQKNIKVSGLIEKIAERGHAMIAEARNTALAPSLEKSIRKFTISQASEILDISRHEIRNLETRKTIPEASKERRTPNGRLERTYTLADINKIRDTLKIRKRKPENMEPAKIAVINFKGGSSKTVTATHQAQALAIKGYRVLLIDCDNQGSASVLNGLNPDLDTDRSDTIHDILLGNPEADIKKIIRKTHWDTLDLIPGNLSLYNAELTLPVQMQQASAIPGKDVTQIFTRLKNAIDKIQNEYDFIVFDCPPSVGAITSSVLSASNSILCPVVPNIVDFSSTIQFLEMTNSVIKHVNADIKNMMILCSKFNGRVTAKEVHEMMKVTFGNVCMASHMIESEAIARAQTEYCTLFEVTDIPGDKKAHNRALDALWKVNDELESKYELTWKSLVVNKEELAHNA